MKHSIINYSIYCLLVFNILSSTTVKSKFSLQEQLKKVSQFLKPTIHEQEINKELAITQPCTLIINNIHGNIEVTSEWKEKKVFLKAVAKTADQNTQAQKLISIKKDGNTITITSNPTTDSKKESINYQLIVPSYINIELTTQNGSIVVHDAKSPLKATTTQGNITILNTSGSIYAETKNAGFIKIQQAFGDINAHTNHGNITVQDTQGNVIAHAQKGNITAHCAFLPQTGSIDLKTVSGNIKLGVPKSVNASLCGSTERGTLTCSHPVKIKPYTTKLDSSAWHTFKKEVNGILGSDDGTITLSSARGHIKILDTTMG